MLQGIAVTKVGCKEKGRTSIEKERRLEVGIVGWDGSGKTDLIE